MSPPSRLVKVPKGHILAILGLFFTLLVSLLGPLASEKGLFNWEPVEWSSTYEVICASVSFLYLQVNRAGNEFSAQAMKQEKCNQWKLDILDLVIIISATRYVFLKTGLEMANLV